VMLLHLGVVSRERFSCLELLKEYIKLNHTEEVIIKCSLFIIVF